MLYLSISKLFAMRGIDRPYTFLVKAGLSPHSATRLIQSQGRVFRMDHIELLCVKFNCTPNDLLVWLPDNKADLPENHPLNKLRRDDTVFNIKKAIENVPLEQLKEIASLIQEKTSAKEPEK